MSNTNNFQAGKKSGSVTGDPIPLCAETLPIKLCYIFLFYIQTKLYTNIFSFGCPVNVLFSGPGSLARLSTELLPNLPLMGLLPTIQYWFPKLVELVSLTDVTLVS